MRAHVLARLLGLKLLRLDADVVLVPATTLVPDGVGRRPPDTEPPSTWTPRHGSDAESLWYARRLLAESEELLDGVRLDPSLPPTP